MFPAVWGVSWVVVPFHMQQIFYLFDYNFVLFFFYIVWDMRTFKVTLFGHSYIRDLNSLDNKQLVVDDKFKVDLRYLFRSGATVNYYFFNEDSYETLFSDSPDVIFIFLGGNDLRIDWDIHETIFRYKSIVQRIALRLPKTAIICAYIEPRFAPSNPYFNTPDP